MWFTVVLIIQILVILSMIAAVLLQRSEGGALGMGGGGGGGGGGLMTSRGAGSALTRATAFLAAMFFICSISLTILARNMIDDGLDFGVDTDTPVSIDPALPQLDIPAVPLGDETSGEEEAAPEDDGPQIPE